MTRVAPFGAWDSPLSAAHVAAASLALGGLTVDGHDVWWIEGRPAEEGRAVVVRWRSDTGARDMIAPPWNARTRVHEYGGGSLAVAGRHRVLLASARPARVPARRRERARAR